MRALVIDQFDISRLGMINALQEMDQECEFFEADTIDEGVAITDNITLDMITIDLDVAEIDGMGMLKKIEKSPLEGNIVLFSIVEDNAVKCRAYEAGISAFIKKQTKKEIIMSVFQIVLAGGRYFSPDIASGKPEYKNQNSDNATISSNENRPILSNRQLEVLGLLSEGKPNKIIARELGIATGTVKVHIAGILKSLKAKNRTQAVSIAKHVNIL